MPKAPTEYSDQEIENLIANHRRLGRTDAPLFLTPLAEHERRRGRGLSFDTTLRTIRAAAAERRFIGYKGIADESGAA